MQLAVVGSGTIGLMAATRLVETGVVTPSQVRLSRIRPERHGVIEEQISGATILEDNSKAVSGADVILLAVKPKNFPEVAAELHGCFDKPVTVISVMAGVNMATMATLGVANLVRASTNIGIQAGLATTYWMVTPGADRQSRDTALEVFEAWGDQIECESEALLDIAMVGVGSGPALVIEFIQAMTQAMVTQGMPRVIAEKGILSLVGGTVGLAESGTQSLNEFQQSVVTPGGITAEALLALDEGRFRATIINAFRRAHRKTSRLAPNDGQAAQPKEDEIE